MSAWTCRQLSERSPKRSFHLVFESHDGTAYVPIPERSTSLRVTSTLPVVDSQMRLTPNGRLEKRTYAAQQVTSLFDHLGGDGKHAGRNCKTERFCSFEVDDKLEFGGLEDWQVGGLRALEDLTGVDADLTPHLLIISTIAHQPASFGLFASGKGCWNPVARRECGELVALANEIRVGGDEQSVDPIAHKGVECRFDFVLGASVEDLHLQSKSTRRLGHVV